MKKRIPAILLTLFLAVAAVLPAAAGDGYTITILTSPVLEGEGCVFEIGEGFQNFALLTVWLTVDGEQTQVRNRTTDGRRCTISAEEFTHLEPCEFTVEAEIYDNEAGTSRHAQATARYERPDAIASAPRILGSYTEYGRPCVRLYYPDADDFIDGEGYRQDHEDGICTVYDSGRYAAVVGGRRTAWVTVTVPEAVDEELEFLDPVFLTLPERVRMGQPVTITVEGDPLATYSYVFEQNGCGAWADGTLPGPGTYTFDLGAMDEGVNFYWGNTVSCYVWARREGYRPAEASGTFEVLEAPVPSAPEVTILTEEPYAEGQPIRFRLYKEGADAYLAYVEEGAHDVLYPAAAECEFAFDSMENSGESGRYSIRFAARVDGVWSTLSERLLFFDIPAAEMLDAPEIICPPVGIVGGTVRIRWAPVPGAQRYEIWADRFEDDYTYQYSATVTGTSAEIPALGRNGGLMDVQVRAAADGRTGQWSDWMSILVRPSTGTLALPDSLEEIGAEAFAGVRASRIVVPAGCLSVGSRAFADTPGLIRVRIPASVTAIASDAFDGSGVCVIEAAPGSFAESWARARRIPVELLR